MERKYTFIPALTLATLLFVQTCNAANVTPLEQGFLNENEGRLYQQAPMTTLILKHQDLLEKLTALKFIEWASTHPNGVAALPAGREAKGFVKELAYYKKHWDSYFVQRELRHHNLKLKSFPDLSKLTLVQTQGLEKLKKPESTPSETQDNENSFFDKLKFWKGWGKAISLDNTDDFKAFAKTNYQSIMGISDENILAIDLTERTEESLALELQELENRLISLGGVGFYLDSMNSESSIGLNSIGTSKESKTRVVKLNKQIGFTIGLSSVLMNKDASIIIVAKGKSKGRAIKQALLTPNPSIPVVHFFEHPEARLYLSSGAEEKLLQPK